MKLAVSALALALAAPAYGFAPSGQHTAPARFETSLSAEKGAKRKAAFKILKRTAGVVGTAAVFTAAAPPVFAAKAAVEIVEAPNKLMNVAKGVGFALSAASACSLFSFFMGGKSQESNVLASFPGAVSNSALVSAVQSSLLSHGYGPSSLLCTSLCCDELSRTLDQDLSKVYDQNFSMGGLAGLPWGGITSFGAMAAHIPDGGSCLVVYGPHVGVDSLGNVGKVERPGQTGTNTCCGSAADAMNHVGMVHRGEIENNPPPEDCIDAQQAYVRTALLPHAERLGKASEPQVELPHALFDSADTLMKDIVAAGAPSVAGEGRVALLGGIQINTPQDGEDYFLPLKFEVRDNKNNLIQDLAATFA